MSVIARTAGIGRIAEELQWDLNYLLQLWHADRGRRQDAVAAPFLIYQESSLVIRAIRDYFHPDIGEILIDTEAIYEQAQQFMGHVMPGNVNRVKLYQRRRAAVLALPDRAPDRDRLRAPGRPALGRRDRHRPHRGAGRRSTSTRRAPPRAATSRKTAFRTNLEAADEIARQLRLRDLGGLIVIDFIDMESAKQPARGREPPARCAALRPRARADRQDLALRPDGAVAPAAAPVARRDRRTSPARAATAPATSAAPSPPRCTSCASCRKRR